MADLERRFGLLRNATRNPSFIASFTAALDRFASGAAPSGEFDRAIREAVADMPQAQGIAGRLARNFAAYPQSFRQSVLGGAAELTAAAATDDQLFRTIPPNKPQSLAIAASIDDVGPAIPPPGHFTDLVTVSYAGLFCTEETTFDGFSNSDEIYAITSVVGVSGGRNITRTERHPQTRDAYEDVDDGEFRDGPVAACWHARVSPISLVVTLMEHDQGDPDAFRDEVRLIVAAAAAGLALLGFTIPAAITALTTELINWLLGTADDLIETQYVVLDERTLRLKALNETPSVHVGQKWVVRPREPLTFPPVFERVRQPVVTPIRSHFSLRHRGLGADYQTLFSVKLTSLGVFDNQMQHQGDGQVFA